MPPSPVPPLAADSDGFLEELLAARLLDAEQVNRVRAEFPGGPASELATFLIQAGLLTTYQAERALAGEAARLVVGPYLLREPIGSGRLGQVFRALNRNDRKCYAVKVLPLRSMWNVLQAKRQLRAFSQFQHPAVVPFVDVDTAGGMHYLAWPFVDGESLERLVRRLGPLRPAHAAHFLAQVAEGLAVCHRHDVTHGLLEPGHLLLTPDRTVRILDLGVGAILSENLADDESMLDTISTTSTTLAAIDCAAPETLIDPTLRTPAGDAYSLGCILYFLLTGVYPFPDGNAVDKILAHQTQTPIPLRQRNPDVPPALAEVAAALLRKIPAERPTDLLAVRETLLAAVPGARDPGELPQAPAEVILARPPAERSHQWSSDTGPFVIPSREQESEDSVSFNVPDPPDVATPPPAPGDTPVRVTAGTAPVVSPSGSLATRPPAQVPPLPPHLRTRWWQRLARTLIPGLSTRSVVQVSLFGTPTLAPGQATRLQVFAHAPEAYASVRTLARAFLPNTELLAAGYARKPVPRGAQLGLYLVVSNTAVSQPLVQHRWTGQPQPQTFELYTPWECAPGLTTASLTVGVDGVEATRIVFDLVVLPRTG